MSCMTNNDWLIHSIEQPSTKKSFSSNIKYYILNGANPNNCSKTLLITPLLMAVTYNDLNLVKFLIDVRADVNIANIHGTTPLMYACKNYSDNFDLPIINLLLDNKADVNIVDNNDFNALMYFIKSISDNSDIIINDDLKHTLTKLIKKTNIKNDKKLCNFLINNKDFLENLFQESNFDLSDLN